MTDTIYIDKSKPRKTLSAIGLKPDTVFPAHTLKTQGYIPYVRAAKYNSVIALIKQAGDNGQTFKELLENIDNL